MHSVPLNISVEAITAIVNEQKNAGKWTMQTQEFYMPDFSAQYRMPSSTPAAWDFSEK